MLSASLSDLLPIITGFTEPLLQQVSLERPRDGQAQGLSSRYCFSYFYIKSLHCIHLVQQYSFEDFSQSSGAFQWPMWVCKTLCELCRLAFCMPASRSIGGRHGRCCPTKTVRMDMRPINVKENVISPDLGVFLQEL